MVIVHRVMRSWLFFMGEQLREGGAIIIRVCGGGGGSPGRQRSRTRLGSEQQLWAGGGLTCLSGLPHLWTPGCWLYLGRVLASLSGHLQQESLALKATATFPMMPLVSQGPHAGWGSRVAPELMPLLLSAVLNTPPLHHPPTPTPTPAPGLLHLPAPPEFPAPSCASTLHSAPRHMESCSLP